MRSGQVWSIDLVLSLVLFGGAMIIAFTLTTNTLQDDGYKDVKQAAKNAASLLVTEGYPEHWSSDTIIRAGLAADGHLSARKARELAKLTDDQLRSVLRLSTPVYVYMTNASGDVIPLLDGCGVGDLVVASTSATKILPAIGIALETKDLLDAITNITVYEDESAALILENADVVIVEGNLTTTSGGETLIPLFEKASRRGMTIVFLGDPGSPMLGLSINSSNATTVQVLGTTGAELGFTQDALINTSLTGSAQLIPTIETPLGDDIGNVITIATTDLGKTAIATWTYHDAQIWYVATTDGENVTGNNITAIMAPALQGMINVSWPECATPTPPTSAKNVAHHDRILPYHDQLITIRTIVWRNT